MLLKFYDFALVGGQLSLQRLHSVQVEVEDRLPREVPFRCAMLTAPGNLVCSITIFADGLGSRP
jgi:hypothetical protein